MGVFDKSGMYEIIESMYEQILLGYNYAKNINVTPNISNVIVAGVGGSIFAGHILKQYLKDYKFPVFVVEDYKIPSFADKFSLVFVISHMGNADEALSMYKDAIKKECVVITIGGGGKLRELASLSNTRHVLVSRNAPSRLAYPSLFFPMLRILENSRLIKIQSEDVARLVDVFKHNKFEDMTLNIAEKLDGKVPIIYASKSYEVVALKWKLNFNETSEIPAFYNTFPSAINNEIAYFSKNSQDFYVFLMISDEEGNTLKRKSMIVKDVLRNLNVSVTEIGITGDCYLVRLFSAMLIGDWLAYHVAIKRGIDPTPTRVVEEVKKRMLL